MHFEKYSRNF